MKFRNIAPFISFILFILAFFYALKNPTDFSRHSLKTIPIATMDIPSIANSSPIQFPINKTYIITVFSSWCKSCSEEHKQLMKFAKARPDIPMYGLVWQDTTDNTKSFLQALGNPYKEVGTITDAQALSMGLMGVPEIFVMTDNNKVLYHSYGAITSLRLERAVQ